MIKYIFLGTLLVLVGTVDAVSLTRVYGRDNCNGVVSIEKTVVHMESHDGEVRYQGEVYTHTGSFSLKGGDGGIYAKILKGPRGGLYGQVTCTKGIKDGAQIVGLLLPLSISETSDTLSLSLGGTGQLSCTFSDLDANADADYYTCESFWEKNAIYLGCGGGALLIAVALLVWHCRRKRQAVAARHVPLMDADGQPYVPMDQHMGQQHPRSQAQGYSPPV